MLKMTIQKKRFGIPGFLILLPLLLFFCVLLFPLILIGLLLSPFFPALRIFRGREREAQARRPNSGGEDETEIVECEVLEAETIPDGESAPRILPQRGDSR